MVRIEIIQCINTVILNAYPSDNGCYAYITPYHGIMTISKVAQLLNKDDLSNLDVYLNRDTLSLTLFFSQKSRADKFIVQVIESMKRDGTVFDITEPIYFKDNG